MNPVLLLHPLGADRMFWEPVLALLPDLPCAAIDLPGHGSAPLPPPGATVADLAASVAKDIADRGWDRCHLVGLSLGGLVAQHLAAERPAVVDRLVLADTVAVYPESMAAMWRERAATARTSGLAGFVEPTIALWFTSSLAAAGDPRVERARRTLVGTSPEGYARTCEVLAAADLTVSAPSIAAPTTVICGVEDALPFTAAALWLAAHVPHAQLRWIPDARHASALERPDVFAALVREALGSPGVGP